jgi:ADP-heptose:LPS heptosyltransferase
MVRTLMLAVDSAACHLSRPTEGGEGGEKILIVRLDAMGDLVLFLDALRELRRIFPSPSFDITLAVNSLWSELLSGQDLVDRILPVDRNRLLSSPWYRFRIMSQLRRGGFQLAVNPAYSREAMLADAMVRATAAPRRVGLRSFPAAASGK